MRAHTNFILRNTHLVQALAEQKLHLITPLSPLWTATNLSIAPYYGFLWPGGYGLTRFIYDHPHHFTAKSCLEIGSGCGSAAIAAIQVGASRVVANDIDVAAGAAVRLNASANNIEPPEVCEKDLLRGGEVWQANGYAEGFIEQFDVVMFADMLYQDARVLERLKKHPGKVFFADPERHVLKEMLEQEKEEIVPLHAYPLPHGEADLCQCNTGFSHTTVYTFGSAKPTT